VAVSKLFHSSLYGVIVEKIFSSLPRGMKALLDQCISRDLYGDQAMTVRHFVTIGLEQLVQQGRLIDTRLGPVVSEGADRRDESGEGNTEG
jgi:hypothetical protein